MKKINFKLIFAAKIRAVGKFSRLVAIALTVLAAISATLAAADLPEKTRCEFQAFDETGAPCAARLFIADPHDKMLAPADNAAPFYLLRGENAPREIFLAAGDYQMIFDAGPRRERLRRRFKVDPQARNVFSAPLAPFHWRENAGWLMLNPLLAPPSAKTENSAPRRIAPPENWENLPAMLRSAGLRAAALPNLATLKPAGDGTRTGESANRIPLNLLSLERGDGWAIIDRDLLPEIAPAENFPLPVKLAAARDRGALTVLTAGGDTAEKLFYLAASDLYQAFDITRGGEDFAFWQFWLRQGYRLPAVAGGGAFPSLSMYAQNDRQLPVNAEILEALRAGRSLVSNAPFVCFYVRDNAELSSDPAGIGDTIAAASAPREIVAEAFASSDPNDTIKQIDLLYNGKVIESVKPIAGEKSIQTRWHNVVLRANGWLQVRYISSAPYLWAITNPLYVGDWQTPRGIVTNLRLTVKTPRAAGGILIAENFGARLWTRPVKNREPLAFRLPATATLIVKIPGFPARQTSVAELSGARAFCERIAKSPARLQPEWLAELKMILRDVEAEVLIGQ